MTGLPPALVPLPLLEAVELDEDPELPDELPLPEDPEPEVDPLAEPDLLAELEPLPAFDLAFADAPPDAAAVDDPPADAPPEDAPPEDAPPAVLPLCVPDPDVPLRDVPAAPAPAPVVPPTMPSRASTSHRITVFVALSSEPFSTTYSTTSPRSTSTRRTAVSDRDTARKGGRYPDCQSHTDPPTARAAASIVRYPRSGRRGLGRSSTISLPTSNGVDIIMGTWSSGRREVIGDNPTTTTGKQGRAGT
jgi:hypothetical protein